MGGQSALQGEDTQTHEAQKPKSSTHKGRGGGRIPPAGQASSQPKCKHTRITHRQKGKAQRPRSHPEWERWGQDTPGRARLITANSRRHTAHSRAQQAERRQGSETQVSNPQGERWGQDTPGRARLITANFTTARHVLTLCVCLEMEHRRSPLGSGWLDHQRAAVCSGGLGGGGGEERGGSRAEKKNVQKNKREKTLESSSWGGAQ
jgi:hypothetical protein